MSIISFETVNKEEILKRVKDLKLSRATRNSDISTKENTDLFAKFLLSSFYKCVQDGSFSSCLIKAEVYGCHCYHDHLCYYYYYLCCYYLSCFQSLQYSRLRLTYLYGGIAVINATHSVINTEDVLCCFYVDMK